MWNVFPAVYPCNNDRTQLGLPVQLSATMTGRCTNCRCHWSDWEPPRGQAQRSGALSPCTDKKRSVSEGKASLPWPYLCGTIELGGVCPRL